MDGAQAQCRQFTGTDIVGETMNSVPCRGAWRQSCEAHGVILGGAASSADLGCSSEYSTVDLLRFIVEG
jgi:hypothetical protein